jgi:hypothetical protein
VAAVGLAVGAAVLPQLGEISIPRLQRAAFRIGPEMLLDGGHGGSEGVLGPKAISRLAQLSWLGR